MAGSSEAFIRRGNRYLAHCALIFDQVAATCRLPSPSRNDPLGFVAGRDGRRRAGHDWRKLVACPKIGLDILVDLSRGRRTGIDAGGKREQRDDRRGET